MKYAVMQCVNGSFTLVSEWTEKPQAIVNFHSVCTTLWNAEDVEHATVVVVDEKYSVHKIEFIKYDE